MNLLEAQQTIGETYPPTHTFAVRDEPAPRGPLAERVLIMAKAFPSFWSSGERFLDVGCNTGFFSFWRRDLFKEIVGIEPDARAINVCHTLWRHKYGTGQAAITFLETSFRSFHATRRFDRIFIGNGPHHLFQEASRTHDWIGKLAALSDGLVLSEGPIDRDCSELKEQGDKWPASFDTLDKEMGKYFELIKRTKTTDYTPERYLTLWAKKAPPKGVAPVIYKAFRTDKYVANDAVTIGVAANSPISNGLIDITADGWHEHASKEEPHEYFENESVLFGWHCDHQIYLARCGYVDLDPATINFFRGSLLMFDKSGVIPIAMLDSQRINAYETLALQSYKGLTCDFMPKIMAAMYSKKPTVVEEVFQWAKSQH